MTRGIKPFVARQTDGVLGQRLRKARKERRLTQKQLAARAGVDQTTISKIESGERKDPSLSTIISLEKALNVSLGSTSIHPSLARFLGSPLAERLKIPPAEADELAALQWWSGPGDPDDDEWYEFVRLRRSVRARNQRGGD